MGIFRWFFKRKNNEKIHEKKNPEKNKKEFSEMTEEERKDFLTNDLIERMIRVEQRVSSSFGEHIPYNKTKYYEGLKDSEKKKFNEYLKKKGMKKYFLIAPLLFFGIFIVLSRVEFTGNAVKNQVNEETLFFLENIFAYTLGLAAIIFLLSFIYKKIKNKKFEKNFDVLDSLKLRRFLLKEEKSFFS